MEEKTGEIAKVYDEPCVWRSGRKWRYDIDKLGNDDYGEKEEKEEEEEEEEEEGEEDDTDRKEEVKVTENE